MKVSIAAPRQRRALLVIGVSLAMIAALLAFTSPAGAAHAEVSLSDSDFEIDTNANLKVDDADPSIDWLAGGTGTPLRDGVVVQSDTLSGSGDNAFGQGSKEDTAVPKVVAGSIPPNKSDLKQFGVLTERNADGNFLHLFWTRVQDPSGTTLMDFEFNENKCDPSDPAGSVCSANGVTPVRTVGDLLITYELGQGGVVAELFLYRWLGSAADGTCEASNKYPCWGEQVALNDSGDAVGSINTSLIPATESGGLGDLDPRTFGEATVDLDAIFDSGACESLGSAYLKSRSSDSFTAALKDFIAPQPITLSNCGTVITRKVTDPTPDPTTTSFDFTNNLVTDPADSSVQSFSLVDGGSNTVSDVLAGSYVITETDPSGDGFDLTGIDCSASSIAVEPTLNTGTRTVSFTLGAGDVLDCTFTNTLQRGSIKIVKNTIGGDGTFDFTSTTLGDFSLTTTSGTNSTLFDELIPGTYDVAETVPTGWDLTSATCDDSSPPSAIALAPGENVICTFENTKRGNITVDKVTDPAGSDTSFGFALTGGPDTLNVAFNLTDEATPFDSGLIRPGTYQVTETVPVGWFLDGANCGSAYTNGGDLVLAAGATITCTFNNSTGAILITKVTKDVSDAFDAETNPDGDGQSPLAGVTFTVEDGEGELVGTYMTDASGEACVTGLVVGADYTITETDAPSGYDPLAVAPQIVTALAADGCGESDAGTPGAADFTNDPLSEIVITFNSLAGDGTLTIATSVVCTGPSIAEADEDGGPLAHTESATYTDLVEGTYECTIVIDP